MYKGILATIASIVIIAISANNVKLSKSSTEANLAVKRTTAWSSGDEGLSIEKCFLSVTEVKNHHVGYRECKTGTSSGTTYPCEGLTSGHSPQDKRNCHMSN
jgi:hypothetical protein